MERRPHIQLERERVERELFTEGSGTHPNWFRTLYHVEEALIVQCFNRMKCDRRFLFQGTSSSDPSNADYRRIAKVRRVQMAMVPAEIRRTLFSRVQEHIRSDSRVNKNTVKRLFAAGVMANEAITLTCCKRVVDYALQNFINYVYVNVLGWVLLNQNIYERVRIEHECVENVFSFGLGKNPHADDTE